MTDVVWLLVTCGARTIDARFELDGFWRLRTVHGTNGVRLAGIDGPRREVVLAALRLRLATPRRSDYEYGGTLVCSINTKPTDGGQL